MPNIMIDEIFPLAMEFLHPIRSSRKTEQEKIISSPNSEKEKLNKVLKCIDRILWNFNLLLYRIVNDNIHFHYSDELLSKMLPKKLLSDNDQAQLFEIMKEIKNGESVISRMSRSQSKKDFIDNMFNNWQISHLHLSCEKHPKHQGLKASTKNLLFFHILIQPNLSRADFFLLDILPHESISKPNKKLVEISYRNWPEVFFCKIPLYA